MGNLNEEEGTANPKLELIWHSLSNHRPCFLLKMGLKFNVLVDCTIDMEPLASFLPCSVVRSNRISWQKKIHSYGKGAIPVLKQLNDNVYVELLPEIQPLTLQEVDLTSIDAVLISNTASLIALPFLTANEKFHGKIYATDPIIQLGKLIMEDMCDMFERVDRESTDEWAWKNIANSFPNRPCSDPKKWCQFYKREVMENCIERINRVFFREEIVLNSELRVAPYSSGYSIGSCNWLICTDKQKIGYLATSSLRHSHPKTMEIAAFSHVDSLIITSISSIDQSPEIIVYKFTAAVVETLKMGGNVMIPIIPTGLIYDLFECVLKAIEVNNLSRSIPVYFISSVAESSLEFANIFPEWLSDDKGSRVYKPEEPFYHSELVRSGRIRVFNSLHGSFSRECRQPCIVFTGHPSLRIGEAVHLLDFWGGDSRNAIMMVDPDYPLEVYYSPYKKLAIRAYYFPIETRLDFTQILNKINNDLSPKHVLYPDEYATIFGTLSALALPTSTIRKDQAINLYTLVDQTTQERRKNKNKDGGMSNTMAPPNKRIRIDSEILKGLKLTTSINGLCPMQGLLTAQKQILELMSFDKNQKKQDEAHAVLPNISKRQQKFAGKIDEKRLMDVLTHHNIDFEQITGPDTQSIYIKKYLASIRILNNGQRTLISCNNESHRKIVQDIIHECLVKFNNPNLEGNLLQ